MENGPEGFNIEQYLAQLAPPSIPEESWDRDNASLYAIRTWKRNVAVATLAGLMTEPAFQANGIRIDWLQRLAFAKAIGERKPGPEQYSAALNKGLEAARVLRLEDPPEDLCCDAIVTKRGAFRIFTGHWEAPAPYTQTLLDAFETLPAASQKTAALTCVYALMRVSEELARRANVDRFLAVGRGQPGDVLNVPDVDTLKQLALRVRFTNDELRALGIERQQLEPFFLEKHQFEYIASTLPGDSPLEFYPLLHDSRSITVANPSGISMAIRATLVDVAKRGGVEKLLLVRMMAEQERYSESTFFWPALRIQLGAPDQHFLRTTVLESSAGRYLQVIQVPVSFDEFPKKAFASVRSMPTAVSRATAEKVSLFWSHLSKQANVRDSTTVLLLSGWGTPHAIDLQIEHDKAPPGWQFFAASFADIATLGACENGKFYSIRRISEQHDRLENDGFSFQNANGLLNLFGFWRTTKGSLIPEHLHEMVPPCNLVLPTDELLAPRVEAAKKRDYRALRFVDGTYKTVLLEDWDTLQPVYASVTDLEQQGRLIGAVQILGRTWWIESKDQEDVSREWRYQTWKAVLQWLTVVGAPVIDKFPRAFAESPAAAVVGAPSMRAFEESNSKGITTLSATVSVSRDDSAATVSFAPDWLGHVQKRENEAEVELIAAVLEALQTRQAEMVSRKDLRQVVRIAIASTDWRWMHTQEARLPNERLARANLLESFHEIPLAAFALAKCQSIWQFRERSAGTEVTGEENCKAFLAEYRDHILKTFISRIRQFNREKLAIAAAAAYQSARHEQSRWRLAIRAMRAIRGTQADQDAFQRQNAINAVQRAAKSVLEIAACEASRTSVLVADQHDLEDLFALALLLFGNGQLFASIRAGLVQPKLRISPAGDLLSDRSVFETAFMPAARIATTKTLDEAADAYGRKRESRDPSGDGGLPIDEAFRIAIEEEYKTTAEAFIDLQMAFVQMAEGRAAGVFLLRRSELVEELRKHPYYPSEHSGALLERLTLVSRRSWSDFSNGLAESDFDLGRFDRRYSLINRPLLSLDTADDPLLLVSPILVSDSTMYALSGLRDGHLQNQFWTSKEAKSYVGARTKEAGHAFEDRVAERLRGLGLRAWTRRKLSWVLNDKADPELGEIDVLAVSADNARLWVIEAKDLRFCRTEAEVSARVSEYRGRMVADAKGRERPDKMLRHIRRVQYLRERRDSVCSRLDLTAPPEVHALLIVDSPQPMNFFMLDQLEDGQSAFLDAIDNFPF